MSASRDAVPGEASGTDEARSSDQGVADCDSPGVLVLAPPLRLLHISQRAAEIIRQLKTLSHQREPAGIANGPLPPPLRRICADIFGLLQERPVTKDWEQLEIKHLIHGLSPPILIRGFGVPDPRGGKHSRLVVLMEPVGRPREGIGPQATERFGFTPREQAVIECLSKGWTNKEIAKALGISLPTVKEHIRHIMEKTKSTNRTGVLVQVLNPDAESGVPS